MKIKCEWATKDNGLIVALLSYENLFCWKEISSLTRIHIIINMEQNARGLKYPTLMIIIINLMYSRDVYTFGNENVDKRKSLLISI